MTSNLDPSVKILLQLFTNRVEAAVRYVSGRALSLAELGAIREQAAAFARSVFLRGKIARFKRIEAEMAPWDPDQDPTDPYVPPKRKG